MSTRLLIGSIRPSHKLVFPRHTSSRRWNGTASNADIDDKEKGPLHGAYHWLFERALSVATLGFVAAAFVPMQSYALVDFGLAIALPLHSHIGFGAILTDYLPRRKYPSVYPLCRGVLLAATGLSIWGLYRFNTHDVGIVEGVRTVWKAKRLCSSDEDGE